MIDAHNSEEFETLKDIIDMAGKVGQVTIITPAVSRGINIVLFDEARERGIYLLDADLSPSSLDMEQFRARGARRPEEKAAWKAVYSLEDTLFSEYESLTKEAKANLNGNPSSKKIAKEIMILQRKILEQKIMSIRSQRRLWEETAKFWEKALINIRLNIINYGVKVLFGKDADKVQAKLSAEENARYTQQILARIDSQIGNFFEYINAYRQKLDYVSRHYSIWQRLFHFDTDSELLAGVKKSFDSTLKNMSDAISEIIAEISAKIGINIPLTKKVISLKKPIKQGIAVVVLSSAFFIF